jgi:hypothetical protein
LFPTLLPPRLLLRSLPPPSPSIIPPLPPSLLLSALLLRRRKLPLPRTLNDCKNLTLINLRASLRATCFPDLRCSRL